LLLQMLSKARTGLMLHMQIHKVNKPFTFHSCPFF